MSVMNILQFLYDALLCCLLCILLAAVSVRSAEFAQFNNGFDQDDTNKVRETIIQNVFCFQISTNRIMT